MPKNELHWEIRNDIAPAHQDPGSSQMRWYESRPCTAVSNRRTFGRELSQGSQSYSCWACQHANVQTATSCAICRFRCHDLPAAILRKRVGALTSDNHVDVLVHTCKSTPTSQQHQQSNPGHDSISELQKKRSGPDSPRKKIRKKKLLYLVDTQPQKKKKDGYCTVPHALG